MYNFFRCGLSWHGHKLHTGFSNQAFNNMYSDENNGRLKKTVINATLFCFCRRRMRFIDKQTKLKSSANELSADLFVNISNNSTNAGNQ